MKKLLLILKIIWTIFAVYLITNSTIDLIKYCEGVDVYIIFFHLYILIKIWFDCMNYEDVVVITLLESTLIIRYLTKYAYYDLTDLVVIVVAVFPILLSWLCLRRKKEVGIFESLYVDRSWTYKCQECGFTLEMALDERLEKHDKNHQPVPFAISCPHCKGMMYHINWENNKTFERRIVKQGESYFKYDTSKKENACGIPIKYVNGVRIKPRKR